ncbi:MAG: hypothetical protein OES25_09840 [Acidobacteriota bacterium]|nr:hypothetical protein [Acidobacteriota bacterium]
MNPTHGSSRTRVPFIVVVLFLALVGMGCRSALRDPIELAPTQSVESGSLDELLERAERSFETRVETDVRQALIFYDEVAARGREETDRTHYRNGLLGAIRVRLWLSTRVGEPDERRATAARAVNDGQLCERDFVGDAACVYWLALAVGAQARERRSTAIDGLDVMEDRLRQAIELDATQDHGGPHRVLALLYLRAPGWPTGPGDPDVGLEQARLAMTIDDSFPPNVLVLGEALVAVTEDDEGRGAFLRARAMAEAWLANGHPEAADWVDEANEFLQTVQ